MRIDASQTDDAALLSSEVRRLAAALGDATAEITRLRAEVERWRAAASPARGRIRCGAEACDVRTLAALGSTVTLTRQEREAIKSAIGDYEQNDMDAGCWQMASTLRDLLARHTDHDAAPAATAKADRERPDNPPARPGDGTGDTPTLTVAEREAVATASRIAGAVGESDVKAALRALLARLGGAS